MTTVGAHNPAYLPRAHAADRRAYPPRYHSRYAAATLLRRAIESSCARHLAPLLSPTLVDFGCGNMPYRLLFARYVARYMGIDLPGNAEADFVLREDGTTSTPDGFADVVLSTQVLEHVADPGIYLRESHRMLKDGGLLVLSTHGLWLYHADPNDYWRWTGPGLQKLIETCGFEMVELEGVLGLLPSGLQLAHDGFVRGILPKALRRFVGPVIALLMQTPMVWLDALHSDAQRRKDAAAFLVVARKKIA